MARGAKTDEETTEVSLDGYISKREIVEYLRGLKEQREIIMRGMTHGTFSHWYTQGAVRTVSDLISYVSNMPTYEI